MCAFIDQEEDFRLYCASLFAVPVSMGRTEPQITTPESCLIIEVLDEVRMTEAFYFTKCPHAHTASQTPAQSLALCLIHIFNSVLFCSLQTDRDVREVFVAEKKTDNNRK